LSQAEGIINRQTALRKNNKISWCGAMAAQLICNQWVAGSTPVTSSKNKRTNDENKSFVRFSFCLKCLEIS
jgi:hypothetical protein